MTMKRVLLLSCLLPLAACSLFPDHEEDYRKAQEVPRVTLPAGGATRPLNDLYPIPPKTADPTWKSKRFEAPKPMPVAISGLGADQSALARGDSDATLRKDGNGYPTLSVTGGFNQVWDNLDQALLQAGVKIDDRNQTLGIYYLSLPDNGGKLQPWQLKVARAVNAYSLSLQKDDDTLAPQELATTLFDKIQTRWHSASGDNDGKARSAVHR
jgi:uncharacterized lipoprotein